MAASRRAHDSNPWVMESRQGGAVQLLTRHFKLDGKASKGQLTTGTASSTDARRS